MKKLQIFAISFLGIATLIAPASAARMVGGDQVSLRESDPIQEDVYAAGGIVSVASDVQGDVLAAGGNVYINGVTDGDVHVVGGDIEIDGTVRGDVRVAGGQIEIGGIIEEDLVVFGGFIRIKPDADLRGNVHIVGGMVMFEGTASGVLSFYGGQAQINGVLHGPIYIEADEVDIQSGAMLDLGGMVKSSSDIRVDENATISGELQKERLERDIKSPKNKEEAARDFAGLILSLVVAGYLIMLVTGLVALKAFPRSLNGRAGEACKDFWPNVGRGFIAAVVVPIAVFLLFLTVFGSFIGAFVGVAFALLVMVAKLLTFFILGSAIWTHLFKQKDGGANWKTLLIGIVAAFILQMIPIFGWITLWIFFLAGLGTMTNHVLKEMKKK